MLRACLKRLDAHELRVRAHRHSTCCLTRQRRRALLAVELLEDRITPSQLTIFCAAVPSGAGHASHARVSSAKAAVPVKHSVAPKVVHATAHSVSAKRTAAVKPALASVFTVSAPTTATAGTTFNITVTAKNSGGKTATAYSGNVTLTASDGQPIQVLRARPFAKGVAVDTVALYTADTLTLTVAAGATKGTSAAIRVNPAGASAFVVNAPSSAMAGAGFGVTLTAKDAYGNTVTGFGGNVTLTSSDGQPVHVVGQTGFSNGTEVFAIVLNTPDMVMLSAVSGLADGASGVVTIKPQPTLSSFVVSAPGAAAAGTGFNVAVTAEDNYGNIVTSFSGSVTLTASDGQTVHTWATPAFSNGTAIVSVTLNTPDTVVLRAGSGMISGTSGSIMVGSASAPSDWFSQNMSDPGLQALARTDFNRDGSLTYSDMLGLFAEAQSAGAITSAELQSLQALVTPGGAAAVNMASSVQSLTYKVVDGDPANAQYQGTTLGNLQAGNPASHLQALVDKWFLGEDTPAIDMQYLSGSSASYALASGTLFGSGGPSYEDVYQGEEGDCWLLASFAVTAAHDPSVIQSMFTSDGTQTENGVEVQVWTVRFYDNGMATYLTVNNYLPASSGCFVYAGGYQSISNPNNVLWVGLAEKAYAQLCESGWNARPQSNAYASLNGGAASSSLAVITGAQESSTNPFASSTSFINAIANGMLLTLGSYAGNSALGVVSDHDYSVLGYNATNQTFTLLNPWGWNNSNAPGILNLTWTQLTQNFFLDGNGDAPSSA